jgi:GNAT superfamily N-acetyltransferase
MEISYIGNNKADIERCLEICHQVFVEHSPTVKGYLEGMADWDICLKATVNGEIVGCYILNNDPNMFGSNTGFDVSEYPDLNTLHGLGLAVLPEYRNLGIGRALRDYTETMGYDYIYGSHFSSLDNLHHWKKVREVVYTSDVMHTTLRDFRPLEQRKNKKLLDNI